MFLSGLCRLDGAPSCLPSVSLELPDQSAREARELCCIINLLVTISRGFMARRKSERVVSAEKRLVERIRQFFEEERRAKHRISLNRVTDRLVAATGLGKTTSAKIHTELLSSQQFQTPQKKR